MNMHTIGICGPSGSGKTTLAKQLSRHGYAHLRQDDYFHPEERMPTITIAGTPRPNWETPDSIDLERMTQDITSLCLGKPTRIPLYDKRSAKRTGERLVTPTGILIVEGFLLYATPELCEQFNTRTYLHASPETLRARRFARQPHLDPAYYEHAVIPFQKQYLDEQRALAHLVLDAEQSCEHVLHDLLAHLTLTD